MHNYYLFSYSSKTVFKDLGQTPEEAEQSVEDYAAEVEELKASFEKKARKTGDEIGSKDNVLKGDDEETPTGSTASGGTASGGTASGGTASGGGPTASSGGTASRGGNTGNTGGTPGIQTSSFDVSGFDKYAMSENKNVLSFEEFVNESRKNGFTF